MIKIKDLNLPRPLNISVLEPLLSEDVLDSLIKEYAGKSRKERRIIFPSQSCLRKCLVFYLVEKHDGDFDAVLDILRGEEKVLGNALLHKGNIKKLYEQRVKEIENENKSWSHGTHQL